jgi:hypothetical protein
MFKVVQTDRTITQISSAVPYIPGIEIIEFSEKKTIKTKSSRFACQICSLEFSDSVSQRTHFKTDIHIETLKSKTNALEDDTKTEDISDFTKYSHLFQFLFFKERDQELAIYRCIVGLSDHIYRLYLNNNTGEVSNALNRLLLLKTQPVKWTILLCRGGHFAGGVVDVSKNTFIVHKALHRYTVRRKQGKAQSSRDNAGHAPKSAGATLRRHNEKELINVIKQLTTFWSDEINESQLIFISTSNPRTYFESVYKDPRVQSIPFPLNRPTFEEVGRIYKRLSSVYRLEKGKEEIEEEEEGYVSSDESEE